MAGNQRRRAIEAELKRRASEEDYESGLAYALGWVARGDTLLNLARSISSDVGLVISPDQLSRWIRGQENGHAELTAARARGAHGLVDQAMDIIEAGGTTREELTHAKMRADVRQWVAERWNRDDFASRNGPQVQISIGSLHLDALRVRTVPVAIASAIVDDAEVLSISETTT